jgi:ribonuclease HI
MEGQGLSGEPEPGVINIEPGTPGLVNGMRIFPAPLVAVGAQIGDATNNETEYTALIAGLRHAIRIGMWRVDVESDSMLVVMQVLAKWKVRDAWLKRLHAEAKALLSLLPGYTIKHIPREMNTVADALSRVATWIEPTLPPPLPVLGRNRSLHEWQAAFIYYHWRAGVRNSYFWGRIYGVDATLIEHVGNGETYKGAKFVGMPEWAYMAPADDDVPAIIENSPIS